MVTIEIRATQQAGHLRRQRNVHTADSSPLCYVTGYPRRLKNSRTNCFKYVSLFLSQTLLARDKISQAEVVKVL